MSEDTSSTFGNALAVASEALANPQTPATASSGTTVQAVDCTSGVPPELMAKCIAAHESYFDHYIERLAHRGEVFAWQHVSTIIIFAVVIGLVLAGIWFAWKQFERDKDKPATENTLELTAKGLKITSSVLGVIILTLSLGFFYLYLVYVYPIQEVF